MAEEFQTGICGGTWWNPLRSSSLSPCSAAGIGMSDHMGSFLWSSSDMVDMKTTTITKTTTTKSCEKSNNSVSADSSMVFQSSLKPQQTDSDSGGSSSILMDSSLQMMSFGPSSSTDWNHALLRGNERTENNYRSTIQEDLNSQIQNDWSPKSFTSAGDDSSINVFKSINQDFPLEQHQLKPVTTSGNCTVTCEGLSAAGFPINSASYGYPSALLQSYFESELQPQKSLYNNRSMNYLSAPNYGTNSNELSPSWPKISPFLKPSLPKQPPSGLHFSNNTPFWNASASASSGLNDTRVGYFPSSQPQFLAPTLEEKLNCPSHNTKSGNGELQDLSGSVGKKGSSEPPFKRPRIETPSPLPTFKVRKEKLGDRITALQQLVSPFGKTDTASVLHEAIEYIKFLHDHVSALTTPYMKQGTQIQQKQSSDKMKNTEEPKQDMKSRGLCLVPIASTFPVANQTTADFWTPTFGGTFR